jgi:hypothetical protein
MADFEQNNQTIQDIGSQSEWTEEELDQFATAVAENVTELLLSGPLTGEQAEAVNGFLAK